MKAALAPLLAALCLFAFAGCGSSGDSAESSDDADISVTTVAPTSDADEAPDDTVVVPAGDDEEKFKEAWPDDVPIMATATHREYQVNIDPELIDLVVTADTVDDWDTVVGFYTDSLPDWEAGDVDQVGPDDDIVHRQVAFTNGDREVAVTLTGDDTRNFQLAYTGPKS